MAIDAAKEAGLPRTEVDAARRMLSATLSGGALSQCPEAPQAALKNGESSDFRAEKSWSTQALTYEEEDSSSYFKLSPRSRHHQVLIQLEQAAAGQNLQMLKAALAAGVAASLTIEELEPARNKIALLERRKAQAQKRRQHETEERREREKERKELTT